MFDSLWINIHAATMAPGAVTTEKSHAAGFGIIKNAALGIRDGRISFIGPAADLRGEPGMLAKTVHDGTGKWVTPALIDCHTHLIYAGNRAAEFEQRLQGVSYADIAKAGGGILSTVHETRAASEDDLVVLARQRMAPLLAEGVRIFEIKSGYGLDLAGERKMLRAATRLRDELGVKIQRSFLGAHALPPEYYGRQDDYIDHICRDMLPTLHAEGLVDAVDGFCENIGFSRAQIDKVFKKARELGLPVKLHAEQLSNQQGAALAAHYNALSADHVEYIDEAGVRAMALAGTVAVLLPAAFYFLREKQAPPVDLFRKHAVPVAIATDHNPGTAPALSLLLMLNMACTLFRLTPAEALSGVTRFAARALGDKDNGTLEKGRNAGFALWDISHPRDLCYAIGGNPLVGCFPPVQQ